MESEAGGGERATREGPVTTAYGPPPAGQGTEEAPGIHISCHPMRNTQPRVTRRPGPCLPCHHQSLVTKRVLSQQQLTE